MNFLDCTNFRDFLAENRDDGTQLWAFHHLPRTGGSSLVAELAWRLEPSYNVHVPQDHFSDENWYPGVELPFWRFREALKVSHFRFVSGHFLRPQIEQLCALPHARLFTILRDPVQ